MQNIKRFYTLAVSSLVVSFFGAVSYFLSYYASASSSAVQRSIIPPFNPYVFVAFSFIFFLVVLVAWSYAFYKLSSL